MLLSTLAVPECYRESSRDLKASMKEEELVTFVFVVELVVEFVVEIVVEIVVEFVLV